MVMRGEMGTSSKTTIPVSATLGDQSHAESNLSSQL